MIAYRSLYSMGTRLEMVFPGLHEEMADAAFQKIRKTLNDEENVLSIYLENSEFALMNANAADAPFSLKPDTFKLIQELLKYNKDTFGCFDPVLGITKSEVYNHPGEDISNLLEIKMEDRFELDADELSIKFNSPFVKFDSGAFGKGYALESIKKILLSFKIRDAFISFGDSSVMTLGKHPAGDHWKVGIRDFVDEEKNAWVFELNNGSVSTSGNTTWNQMKTEKGHLVDPLSGKKKQDKSVVSVMGDSAMVTEIISTALFVAGKDKRKLILERFPQYTAVELVYNEDKLTTEINVMNS
ncbi:MAG: FAD:protein FMN transferase [Bacteroidales bacterium]